MKKKLMPFISLRYHDFRLLLFAIFISQLGIQMEMVTINWHIYVLTHSPIYLGLIGLAGFLPVLVFSLLSGTLADRFDRKLLYTLSLSLTSIAAGVLAVTTFLHVVSPAVLYSMVIITAVAATLGIPSRQSIAPALIPKEHFLNAMSMSNMVWQATVILGPMAGGFLIAFYGVQSVYTLNFLACIIASLVLLFMHVPKKEEREVTNISLGAMKEGIQFVIKTPIIYSTMLVDFFATFFASASVLMPIFARDILRVGPQGVGLLYAAPAIGALLSGLLLSLFHNPKHQGRVLLGAVVVYGMAIVGFGFSRIFLLSLFFLGLSGAGDMVSAVIRNTVRQMKTPDYLRGRMTAINMNFFMGGPYLGDLEAGITAHWWGAPGSVIVGGIGTIVFTLLVALVVPKLREYTADQLAV